MKTITLLIVLATLMLIAGCDESKIEYKHLGYNVSEMTIDGCQYLYVFGSYSGAMVHKGNCTNHKKEETK